VNHFAFVKLIVALFDSDVALEFFKFKMEFHFPGLLAYDILPLYFLVFGYVMQFFIEIMLALVWINNLV